MACLPLAFLSSGLKPQLSTAGPLLGLCPALHCPCQSSGLMGASPDGDGGQGLGVAGSWVAVGRQLCPVSSWVVPALPSPRDPENGG